MENKVFYGEYTLDYWVKLILQGNIVLPPYQRYFVWKEEDIVAFVSSLKELSFAPSVIIGSFWNKSENKQVNYIIDGQQRLTAVLLAALGVIPNPKRFKTEETEDIIDEAASHSVVRKKMVWTFSSLIKKRVSSLSEVEYDKSLYNGLSVSLTPDDLKKYRLGYAYIIPQMPSHDDENKQQECFSKLFRNINFQGVALDKIESRRSLYFLNATYADWFDPKFLRDRGVDFVRYASLLTNYHKCKSVTDEPDWGNIIPANRRSKDYEKYYEKYIYSITGATSEYTPEELEKLFGKFSDIFVDNKYADELNNAKSLLESLDLNESALDDTIRTDLYLFGLFHYSLFEKKRFDFSDANKEKLKEQIEQAHEAFRRMPNHSKSPNTKTYLKNRIEKSLYIYEKYLSA